MIRVHRPHENLATRLEVLEIKVDEMKEVNSCGGLIFSSPPHIATIAIFLQGGQTVKEFLTDETIDLADDIWPDLILLLGVECFSKNTNLRVRSQPEDKYR